MYMVRRSEYPLDLRRSARHDNGGCISEGVGKYDECLFLNCVVCSRSLTKIADERMGLAFKICQAPGEWYMMKHNKGKMMDTNIQRFIME
jgi:hypothetical protein